MQNDNVKCKISDTPLIFRHCENVLIRGNPGFSFMIKSGLLRSARNDRKTLKAAPVGIPLYEQQSKMNLDCK